MTYRRSFSIDRAKVNEATGEFRAVLFTDGEASDGHILDVRGGYVPEQMPLFINHFADPELQLGSVFFERKTAHRVHVRGQIFLDGEGAQNEIRRDIMAKIAAGHVSRMSGRWDADPENVKRRTELPKDHYAHVKENERGRKRYGMFFEKWHALEGSIVGLGADPQATMRWAEESDSEPVREFWRAQAEAQDTEHVLENGKQEEYREETQEPEAEDAGTEAREAVAEVVEIPAAESSEEPRFEPPSDEAVIAAFCAQVRELTERGIARADIEAAVFENLEPTEEQKITRAIESAVAPLLERINSLETQLRVGESEPAAQEIESPVALLRRIRTELASNRAEALDMARALVDERRGRIIEERKLDGRKQAFGELKELLLKGVK